MFSENHKYFSPPVMKPSTYQPSLSFVIQEKEQKTDGNIYFGYRGDNCLCYCAYRIDNPQ